MPDAVKVVPLIEPGPLKTLNVPPEGVAAKVREPGLHKFAPLLVILGVGLAVTVTLTLSDDHHLWLLR